MGLDLFLITAPGKQTKDKLQSRTDTAIDFFKNTLSKEYTARELQNVRLVAMGEKLNGEANNFDTDAYKIERRLLEQCIPEKNVVISPHGRDAYTTSALFQHTLEGLGKEDVGLVGVINDEFYMNRFNKMFNLVYPNTKILNIGTGVKGNPVIWSKERILESAFMFDLKNLYDVDIDKVESMEGHLDIVKADHPMYAPNNSEGRWGAYDTIVKARRSFKNP